MGKYKKTYIKEAQKDKKSRAGRHFGGDWDENDYFLLDGKKWKTVISFNPLEADKNPDYRGTVGAIIVKEEDE